MRFALCLLILFLLATGVHAQTTAKEQTLYERIMKPDTNKTFDPSATASVGSRSFHSGAAPVKEFHFDQRFSAKPFAAREFSGAKSAWMGDFKFSTSPARAKGDYAGPHAGKQVDVKPVATKQASDAGKTAATRELPGANRPYMGPEAAKLKQALDPNRLPRSSNELHELKTVEDIRALLNKNK